MGTSGAASHCSILLVEDEPLLAMDMELVLLEAGFQLAGMAMNIRDAMGLLQQRVPDLTILDLNLGGEMVFPLLDILCERDIPFVVLSGHSRDLVPARHRHRPYLQKPCDPAALLAEVRGTLNQHGGGELPA